MEPNFLLVNKPVDWTSHDVVAFLRSKLKIKKIGHAGTLDPFATGLLIVGVGREATKRLDEFKSMKKEYIAKIKLGETSNTDDCTGEIKKSPQEIKTPEEKEIKEILQKFIGKQLQIPPMFSAKKVNGQKLYDLARKGIEIERKPAEIEIYQIELINYHWPFLEIKIQCSTGTYIRTLAHDIGEKIGCGAYCEELTRTKIGEYSLSDAKLPEELSTLPENNA
jgi:tRNA pseudouridine55 synthase